MSQEKRRFSRIFFDVRAKLEVEGATYVVERIANLSVGGCLIRVGDTLQSGSPCTFTILLDRMAPGVEVIGEVLRSADGEVVIKFTAIEPEDLFHLQNIIRYNAEDPDNIEDEIIEHPGLI